MKEDKNYYQLTAKEVIKELETGKDGLPRDKSKERLKKYGKNELEGKGGVPKWVLFLVQSQKQNPTPKTYISNGEHREFSFVLTS